MIDVNILKCEFVRLLALYSARRLWGLECDDIFCNVVELYNYIKIVENISTCAVDSNIWEDIAACVARIQSGNHAARCNNC